ncbi:FUSC family protein [Swingsia samuiensis]|uniref:FUSC family protein n=1 Tax=Swingsia samuiensis TaxID=1293412 RepID=A0A4Y6UHG5_9PROT|nr:FUSC family protein [Swingsia samuiensis]QDH16250.1 FUSC family protein [Swingsia samuiensis]
MSGLLSSLSRVARYSSTPNSITNAPPLKPKGKPFLSWLWAPSTSSLTFSLRTTIAACIALCIAFWMELDSPAWAAMTVWAVAQATRGESQSKAKWRMIGTLIGAAASIPLMAAAPQAPWLFFPMIAIWVGICSGLATFVSNFRSYALVLAGYTCSIICMDSIPNPDNVFFTAMARSTYILLGVVCEAIMGLIFATSQERQARAQLKQKLESALILVTGTIRSILSEERGILNTARKQFDTILNLNDQIEFAEVEMGPHGHEGDHARAALSSVSALLSRGLGMAMRLHILDQDHPNFTQAAEEISSFLKNFPQRLSTADRVSDLLAELQHLRDICLLYSAPPRSTDTSDVDTSLLETNPLNLEDTDNKQYTPELSERVLFVTLAELLGDLETAIKEYEASTHTIPKDHFHFRRETHRDFRDALNNGVRVMGAVIVSALIYEVTAWPNGLGFIAITSLICGLFATKENPVLGTISFLQGAIAAYFAAWFIVFVCMPRVDTFETLMIFLGPAMFIGGLAKGNPSTAGAAAAYSLLFPAMLGLQNHHIMNEIAFFNSNMATVSAAILSVIIFRTILPFNPSNERLRLRRAMLSDLRALADPHHVPEINVWIGRNTERFARIIRHAGPTPAPLIEAYILGTLASLTLGLNIIRLRALIDREYLPESGRRPIQLVLHYVETATHRYDKAARVARATIRRLRYIDEHETDLITRLEITRAITYLVVVSYILETNKNFLNPSKRFKGEISHLSVQSETDQIFPI